MRNTDDKITCSYCGTTLTNSHSDPCPACGKVGKKYTIDLSGGSVSSGSVDIITTKTFYQKTPVAHFFVILLIVISPFIGFFLIGFSGVIVGLILGAVSYFLGPQALTKIIEKNHY
jgi:hypothetical protein